MLDSFFSLISSLFSFVFFVYSAYFLIRLIPCLIIAIKRKTFLGTQFKPKLAEFLKWVVVDIFRFFKTGKKFNEFGLTLYANKQGSGKTLSLVEYLERMRAKYPKVKIYTNFDYLHQDGCIDGWQDLVSLRNGEDGVIFAIDELQNEWDCMKYKDVPEWILSEITQQRKQNVKIVATSQVFTRVAKQFREQCFDVVECNLFLKRWCFQKSFDAYDYEAVIQNPDKKMKLRRLYRRSFIATDDIRSLFDTKKKIDRIKQDGFKPRVINS